MTDPLRITTGPDDTRDRSWMQLAACRGLDPDLFFPGRGEPSDAAKLVCATCPVLAECREYGMDEHFGVWGGLGERMRRRRRAGWRRERDQRERRAS